MKFEEADEQFDLEKTNKRSVATKIRMVTLFVVFILVICFFVKNDFSFAFGLDEKFEMVCGPANTRKSSDDAELALEKAQKAVASNYETFESIGGFSSVKIKEEPVGYKGSLRPVIKITFSEENEIQKNLPEEICGFGMTIMYK